MDGSGGHPGHPAEVSGLPGSLRGALDRTRAFALNRNAPAGVAADSVRLLAAISSGETPVSLRRRERGSLKSEKSSSHDPNRGECIMKTTLIGLPKVVSRAKWIAARNALRRSPRFDGRRFYEMNRRRFLHAAAAALPFLPTVWSWVLAPTRAAGAGRSMSRVRPGDSAWPSEASWDRLSRDVGGRLAKVQSPLAACLEAPSSPSCAHVFKKLKNPCVRYRDGAHQDPPGASRCAPRGLLRSWSVRVRDRGGG